MRSILPMICAVASVTFLCLTLVSRRALTAGAGAAFLTSSNSATSGAFQKMSPNSSSNGNSNTMLSSFSSSSSSHLTSIKSYYQLQVDEHGETSIAKQNFHNVETKGYSNAPQLVQQLDPEFATPTNVIFTQLAGENPWHHCPAPQLVVCLAGSWYIRTTDGNATKFYPGDVLYQDNTEQHPAVLAAAQLGGNSSNNNKNNHIAMHYSGSNNNKPCDQMIVQLDLKHGSIANSKHKPPPF